MAKKKKKNPPARSKARKSAPARKTAGRKTAKRAVKRAVKKAARKASAKATRKPATRAAAKKKPVAKKVAQKAAKKAQPKKAPPKTAPKVAARRAGAVRRPPALDRERRTIREDETIPGAPSSLNFDSKASSARSGHEELIERLRQHTSTGPALTGGDVDADWEDAESVGDEAPGGDNPTPDQDIVDEIGEAIGLTYEDNEPLKGSEKILERDRHRWELDPASRDDYDEED